MALVGDLVAVALVGRSGRRHPASRVRIGKSEIGGAGHNLQLQSVAVALRKWILSFSLKISFL